MALSALAPLGDFGILQASPLVMAPAALTWPPISLDAWTHVLQLSLPLFLILFAESWASIRGLALLHGDAVEPNRELVALGLANIAAGLLQGMPVGAGFSASSAAEAAGAGSKWAGAAALAVFGGIACFGGRLVGLIPQPVLAAVVIGSLFHALNPAPLTRLWRLKRDEVVASAAALAVLGLGVLDGMLAAILISLLALLERFSAVQVVVLGQMPGGQDFADAARNPDAVTRPDILILRPMAPLFFANAERAMAEVLARARSPVRIVILSLEESPDLDSTALDALLEAAAELRRKGCALLLARVKDNLRDLLRAAGAEALADNAHGFRSVADAYQAACRSIPELAI